MPIVLPLSCIHSPTDKPSTTSKNPKMSDFPDDLTNLPADIQNYMRKLAEVDIFLTGRILKVYPQNISFNFFQRKRLKTTRRHFLNMMLMEAGTSAAQVFLFLRFELICF